MGSLTSRGRALVVVAFVLSAALAGSAAVALVVVSRDDAAAPTALPTVHPTLITPSQSPTPSPTAVSPSPKPTASPRATTTPSPTAAATSSPAPRATTSARPSPPVTEPAAGLYSSAEINIASGGTTADEFRVTAHATDGDGTISLRSLDWGDGSEVVTGDRGAACSPAAKAPADCRDFSWPHSYAASGTYTITVILESDEEVSDPLRFTVKVDPAP